ncbi:MAG: hypothetical protein GF383_08515 [Candidatus Lokiarchaeota archaeon]|nr:hypothetical protein [Candidatus Lokiarchaeota archaeon]MBD3340415.1 hypothetical protein [Candidatus Lokiarchaeota archaeon]
MFEVTGFNLQFTYNLANNYNPEKIDAVKDKISLDFENVKPQEFYDANDVLLLLNEFSPAAKEVIGKQVYPSLNKITGAFGNEKDPIKLFKTLPVAYLENNRDSDGGEVGNWHSFKVIDNGKIEIQDNTKWPIDFNRGILIGILNFVGIRGNIRAQTEKIGEKDGLPNHLHTVVWT